MIEVLVEITAAAGVVLRGSTTGVVLSDGRSFSDFDVVDFQAELRLGRFPTVDDPAEVWLDAPFDKIRVFDDRYGLAGRAVRVWVGQGRDASGYVKPSSGTARGLVWTFHGFVPINWVLGQNVARGTARLTLKDALGYRSHPILTDHVSGARAFSPGAVYPILFGAHDNSPPGEVIFPMQRVDIEQVSPFRGTWALGNLPLAERPAPDGLTGTPQPLEDVIPSPYEGRDFLDGEKDVQRALFSNVTRQGRPYPTERVVWYVGAGIGTTTQRPLPGLGTGVLIESLGHVLYWLLRYRGGLSAGVLHHQGIYGADAPPQVTSGACYYMVDRPLETARAAEAIGRECLAPLRQVDGFRLGAGAGTRWTLADVYMNELLGYEDVAPIDPGWLLKDARGLPDIQPVAAHRLYANSVDISYGVFPAVTDLPSQPYYLDGSESHAADQAARGVKHLELAFTWNNSPNLLLGNEAGFGLASDRWGSWTLDGTPLTYRWAFRLPYGDVLPGDLCHFGAFAQDPTDADHRNIYVVESTRLDWRAGLLECRGPALRLLER